MARDRLELQPDGEGWRYRHIGISRNGFFEIWSVTTIRHAPLWRRVLRLLGLQSQNSDS